MERKTKRTILQRVPRFNSFEVRMMGMSQSISRLMRLLHLHVCLPDMCERERERENTTSVCVLTAGKVQKAPHQMGCLRERWTR